MRWIAELAIKIYAFFFAWQALGQAVALNAPDSDTCIYYHVLMTLHPEGRIVYYWAWANTILTTLCLYPLFQYAFNSPRRAPWLLMPLFFMRLISEIFGHNYELQFLRSAFQDGLVSGLLASTIALLIVLPSYYAHFQYAFKKEAATT